MFATANAIRNWFSLRRRRTDDTGRSIHSNRCCTRPVWPCAARCLPGSHTESDARALKPFTFSCPVAEAGRELIGARRQDRIAVDLVVSDRHSDVVVEALGSVLTALLVM